MPTTDLRGGVLRRLRGLRHDDSGSGLVLVIGSMMLLATLSLTALAYSLQSQRFARYDQDYTAAMAAAQSGVDEFISRLNRAEGYGLVVDCTNDAWRGPTTVTNSCGWNATTPAGWALVEASNPDPDAPAFHYAVDASSKLSQGTIALTVTGRSNGVYRTIETAVGKGGSTDYVYYTDFESADPANVQAYNPGTVSGWSTAKRNACGINGYNAALYWYEKDAANRTRDYYDCTEITFIGGDELDGEVFTNDTIFGTAQAVSGVSTKPSFLKQVYTAHPTCDGAGANNSSWEDYCLRASSVANFNGKKPLEAQPKYLDDTSAAFANHPGCHYFGSTRVIFNSNGTMTVWNKTSVNNNTAPVAIGGPAGTPTCGSLTALNSAAGATVDVPDEMVIYTATSTAPMRQCYAGEIGGASGRTLPLGSYLASTPATPVWNTPAYVIDTNMTEATKMCARGNLYVEGTVNGRVTISAAESIVVTGDLVLEEGLIPTSGDMLGLVATNSVEIFHPRLADVSSVKVNSGCSYSCAYKWSVGGESEAASWPTRYTDPTTGSVQPSDGIQIAGSIQTLQHSFLVQKYSVGGQAGKLVVNGSIAQRWRGIVGQGTNGYLKDYNYDTRLQYSAPPYFPKWADSQWSLRYSGEIDTPSEVRSP